MKFCAQVTCHEQAQQLHNLHHGHSHQLWHWSWNISHGRTAWRLPQFFEPKGIIEWCQISQIISNESKLYQIKYQIHLLRHLEGLWHLLQLTVKDLLCGKRVFESHNTKRCRAQMPAQLAIQVPGDTFRPQRRLWPPKVQHVMSRFHASSIRLPCLPCHVFHVMSSMVFRWKSSTAATGLVGLGRTLFVKALIPATKHPSKGSSQGFIWFISGSFEDFRGGTSNWSSGKQGRPEEWCHGARAGQHKLSQTQSSCISKCVFALCKATKDAEHAVFTMKLGPLRLTT